MSWFEDDLDGAGRPICSGGKASAAASSGNRWVMTVSANAGDVRRAW
jgi:hypothetical protein